MTRQQFRKCGHECLLPYSLLFVLILLCVPVIPILGYKPVRVIVTDSNGNTLERAMVTLETIDITLTLPLKSEADTNIILAITIIYILLIGVFAFVMLYPSFRDFCLDFFESKSSGEVVGFCLTLMAVCYSVLPMYYWTTDFIAAVVFFISIFSGLELIYLSGSFKINLVLFIVSFTLPVWSFIIQGISQVISLIKGIFYLIGIGESAGKHLLPLAKEFSGKFDPQSYAEAFVTLFMTICTLTIVLDWLSVETLSNLKIAPDLSDIGFITGGLIGFLLLQVLKKTRIS